MVEQTKKLKFGVGINDGTYPTQVNKKAVREYSLWNSIICRSYSPLYHIEKPTYMGCEVSDNFKHYKFFYEWCQEQIGFHNKEIYHIDKDILVKGNKKYSEDTCVFVPKEINAFLTLRKNDRGSQPIGVSMHGSKYKASCNVDGSYRNLGVFSDSYSAFLAYKECKESIAKVLAERYKYDIDPRVYEALMTYEVFIDD